MFGNVEITVFRFTVSGREVAVPPDSPAFTIRQNQYMNGWLGVRIVKPESFRFVSTDSVWPDATLVALEGPRKELLSLERIHHLTGRDAGTQALVYLRKTESQENDTSAASRADEVSRSSPQMGIGPRWWY
jgi:hypothetical protein